MGVSVVDLGYGFNRLDWEGTLGALGTVTVDSEVSSYGMVVGAFLERTLGAAPVGNITASFIRITPQDTDLGSDVFGGAVVIPAASPLPVFVETQETITGVRSANRWKVTLTSSIGAADAGKAFKVSLVLSAQPDPRLLEGALADIEALVQGTAYKGNNALDALGRQEVINPDFYTDLGSWALTGTPTNTWNNTFFHSYPASCRVFTDAVNEGLQQTITIPSLADSGLSAMAVAWVLARSADNTAPVHVKLSFKWSAVGQLQGAVTPSTLIPFDVWTPVYLLTEGESSGIVDGLVKLTVDEANATIYVDDVQVKVYDRRGMDWRLDSIDTAVLPATMLTTFGSGLNTALTQPPTANSVADMLHKDGTYTYDNTTDSLEAVSDVIPTADLNQILVAPATTTISLQNAYVEVPLNLSGANSAIGRLWGGVYLKFDSVLANDTFRLKWSLYLNGSWVMFDEVNWTLASFPTDGLGAQFFNVIYPDASKLPRLVRGAKVEIWQTAIDAGHGGTYCVVEAQSIVVEFPRTAAQ